jgi:hypothetical protein
MPRDGEEKLIKNSGNWQKVKILIGYFNIRDRLSERIDELNDNERINERNGNAALETCDTAPCKCSELGRAIIK